MSGALERFLLVRGERVVRVPPQAVGGRAPHRRASPGSPTSSTRRRSRAPRFVKASTRSPSPISMGPSSRSGCWLDHRERLGVSAHRADERAALVLHDSGPSSTSRARVLHTSVAGHVTGASLAPTRPPGFGSRATAAPHPRAHAHHRRARARTRRAGRRARAAAARRARLRRPDRREADRRDRRHRPLRHRRQTRPHSRHGPAPRQLGRTIRHRLDRGGNRQLNAALHRIAITKAPRPRNQGLPRPQTPKARPAAKRSAASNDTSHDASGTSSNRPNRPRQTTRTRSPLAARARSTATFQRAPFH